MHDYGWSRGEDFRGDRTALICQAVCLRSFLERALLYNLSNCQRGFGSGGDGLRIQIVLFLRDKPYMKSAIVKYQRIISPEKTEG